MASEHGEAADAVDVAIAAYEKASREYLEAASRMRAACDAIAKCPRKMLRAYAAARREKWFGPQPRDTKARMKWRNACYNAIRRAKDLNSGKGYAIAAGLEIRVQEEDE